MKRSLFVVLSLMVAVSMLLAACGPATPAVTEVPPTEAPTAVPPTEAPTATPEPAIGSPEHPIKVLFVPSVDAQVIVAGGQVMADALNKATGLTFEVSVPTSYAATIEEVCASPKDTMAFIPALGYVLGNQLCGIDVAFKADRRGVPVYWSAVLVARDSEYQTLADLNGKKWGYVDAGSTSGYMVPMAMWQENGVTPSESVETGGHPQAVQALYNGEVDFATVFYNAPVNPEGKNAWSYQDYLDGKVTPEQFDVPADVLESCKLSDDAKKVLCSGWEVVDARATIREASPDVVQKVRVLALSPAVPNDTLSFGPEFPADVRAQIEAALVEFSKTEEWKTSIGSRDFYNWSGLTVGADSDYDFVRKMVAAIGLTLETYGKK